jgi:hypothetical protein
MKLVIRFAVVPMIFLSLIELAAAGEDRGMALYREVVEVGRQCAKENPGSQVISCFVRASPKKCESYVYSAFTQEEDAQSSAKRAWAYCVASCLNANFWSRNFGECARELK